jgi:hypothetical protein
MSVNLSFFGDEWASLAFGILICGLFFRRVRSFFSTIDERCAYTRLNYEIKLVLASKNELTQAHIDPISTRKWKEVLAWIAFKPEELVLVDKKKQTILHHCCLFRAPAIVIEMILFQAPELVSKKNVDGEIPLHWAVRLSAPIEVLQLLLSVEPALGCTSKDKDGNTALSLTWERHSAILIRMWWEEGKEKIVNFHWWKRIMFLLELHMRESNSTKYEHDGTENTSSQFLELHAATLCPNCPISLYPLVLKIYRYQVMEKDAGGRLPLEIACLNSLNNRSSGILTKIQLLLLESSRAASVPDMQQRLPLSIALESGIVVDEGISELISAFPKGLQMFDPVTKFAPFLLAAVGIKKREFHYCHTNLCEQSEGENQRDEIRTLSTIYTILREEPSQLSLQMLPAHEI